MLWSSARSEWVACPPDEITWLDRELLSGNEDLTLHRAPRCAGLRYVHRRWELFSRDTTYRVYLAPQDGGAPVTAAAVQRAARISCRPPRPGTKPSRSCSKQVSWLVSVGNWVLRLRLDVPARRHPSAAQAGPVTQDGKVRANGATPPGEEAVTRVRGYFERNTTARMAMAFYYQQFILGLAAPQTLPMMDVAVALDLSGEGAVSDYKKLLQGLIWNERGHARNLADFLLSNGLLTLADLDEARQIAAGNERRGVSGRAGSG